MFFFARIITNIFLKVGTALMIFSSTTFPTKPVVPVIKIVLPA